MLYTLGRLELSEPAYRHVKPLLFLTYLSLEGPQERRYVADLFWPDSKHPLNALSALLFRLRRDAPEVVGATETTVWSHVTSDAALFLNATERGLNEKALELYRGPFLKGVVVKSPPLETWLYSTREMLSQRAFEAALSSAEGLATRGELALAAQQAEAALSLRDSVALEPDTLGRTYHLLYLGKSAKASALKAEAQEFGLDLSSYEPSTMSSSGVSPVAFQDNLPKVNSAFVGRCSELGQLSEQLVKPECRLLSLLGPGGVGKSRLALELARQHLNREPFQDGVVWVGLEALTSPELIPVRLADALGVTLQGKDDPWQQVTNFLDNKRSLLILDNFEHLLEGSAKVGTLLANCPNVKVLATSRTRLNLQDEWSYPLDGLGCPNQGEPHDVLTYDAPTLFYQHAKRTQLGFELDSQDAAHLQELCQLVSGFPLALELAATWLRTLPLEAIVQEIKTNLDFLVSLCQDTTNRHQSMRAVLSQSWERLTSQEQTFLAKLSVFEGGFTREAAAEVADASLLMLTRLIDKSLVRREPGGRYGFHPLMRQFAGQKLCQNESLLSQARERHAEFFLKLAETAEPKLTGPEQGVWLGRLEEDLDNFRSSIHFFLAQHLTEQAFRLVIALSRFWLIRGYISEARQWFAETLLLEKDKRLMSSPGLKVTLLRLAGDLADLQGEFQIAHEYLRKGMTIAEELNDKAEIASYHSVLGNMALNQGDNFEAQKHHERSLSLKETLGDCTGIAKCLNNLGITVYNVGKWSLAKQYHEKSLHLYKELGNQQGVVIALNNLGNVLLIQGNYSEAQRCYEESLLLSEELGNQRGTSHALNNLALVAHEQEDYTAAQRYQERSLLIKRELGEQHSIAVSLMNLGDSLLRQNDYEAAERHYLEALSIMKKFGNAIGTAIALHSLGVLANECNSTEGRTYLAGALKLWRTSESFYPARSLEELGNLAQALHQGERAVKLWARASMLRKVVGSPLKRREQERYEKNLMSAREKLGVTAFQAAWAAGEAMTLEEAIDYALQDPCDNKQTFAPSPNSSGYVVHRH